MSHAAAPRSESKAWLWILIIIAFVIGAPTLCVIGCCGCAGLAVSGQMNHPAYKDALARVQAEPWVTERLGEVSGTIPIGDMNDQGGDGTIDFTFPVNGSQGKAGMAEAAAAKNGDAWTINKLSVQVDGETHYIVGEEETFSDDSSETTDAMESTDGFESSDAMESTDVSEPSDGLEPTDLSEPTDSTELSTEPSEENP